MGNFTPILYRTHLDFLCYFDEVMPKTATAVTMSRNPVQVDRPYPSLFKTLIGDGNAKICPSLTLWQSSRNSGKIVKNLAERTAKVNLHKMHRFEESGLEQDELTAVIEDLITLSECYDKPSDAI